MTGLRKVLAGVLVRAGITASDVPACEAHPQVRPRVLAVLAAVLAVSRRARIRLGGINRGFEVFACFGDRGGFLPRKREVPPLTQSA
jgi:hypothetical protein